MAKKKTIITDTFEQVAELGSTAAKRTVKNVKDIVMDVGTARTLERVVTDHDPDQSEKTNGKKNHTPLDLNGLEKKYQDQDKQKEKNLRIRLLQLISQEEGRVLAKKKQEKKAQEQQVVQEEEEEKKQEEEKKKQREQGAIPQGKKRRSIFSPKKKSEEQHMETRPSIGKQ